MSHAYALGAMFACAALLGVAGHADAQLWVSAGQGGHFAGAQIVHVIVDAKNEIAEVSGEPGVTVGSNALRMIQGTDGRWHAYFAIKDAALTADGTVAVAGQGLDFGTICGSGSDADELLGRLTLTEQDYFESDGVAFPLEGECGPSYGDGARAISVLRDERRANTIHGIGQSIPTDPVAGNIAEKIWPFVQLYDLGRTTEVEYGRDRVGLEYVKADDIASLALDRQTYPPGADVHVEITNSWFNIDPTEKDSWTWVVGGPEAGGAIYRAFDSRGAQTGNRADVSGAFGSLGCGDACSLGVDLADGALETVRNGNGEAALAGLGPLLTLVETGESTGVFVSYDGADRSSLKVSASAPRGTAPTVEYQSRHSVVIGLSDAALGIGPGASTPGTRTSVTLSDTDANQNSRKKDSLAVSDPGSAAPTIVTGDPLTLADAESIVTLNPDGAVVNRDGAEIEERRHRAVLSVGESFEILVVDFGSLRDRVQALPTITSLLNYDMRSLGGGPLDIYAVAGSTPVAAEPFGYEAIEPVAVGAGSRGLAVIPDPALEALAGHAHAGFMFEFSGTPASGAGLPVVADVFSFGTTAGGERVANQIVRLELEETDDDTGTFVGMLEYMMANQLSIGDPRTYADLATIGDRATMVVVGNQDEIVLEYVDEAADGSSRTITVPTAPRTHQGSVSFDRDEYGTSDTVVVTLRDADLNTSPDTIESYGVGADGSSLLVLTLNGVVWTDRPGCSAPGPSLRLVETGPATGVFSGELRIPRQWCDGESPRPVTTANTRIGITYADYTRYDEDITVIERAEPARAFPLRIEGVRVGYDGDRGVQIAASVLGEPGTVFDLVAQVTDERGQVRHVATKSTAIISEAAAQIRIDWAAGPHESYTVEVFAWTADGAVLSEPAAPAELEGPA